MEKTNKIFLTIIIICAVLVAGICAYAIANHDSEVTTDAIKFKNEYEKLNGIETGYSDKVYLSLEISEENPVVYKTGKEILEVLENENAVVYFGFSTCPWCRRLLPTLLDVAEKNGIEKIYYVDIKDIRDTYEFSGSIIPEKTKKGTDAYYEILDFFGDKLEKYYISDEAGNRYDTGVTRLYAPTIIAVQDGEIMDMHVGTVESQTDPFADFTEDQAKELTKEIEDLIKSIKNDTCSSEGC